MNGTLKRFLRLYPIMRNWTVLSNYIAPLQSIQKVSRAYSTSLTGNRIFYICISVMLLQNICVF